MEESPLEKMFLWLPPIVLALFFMNHSEILTKNWNLIFPFVVVAGLWVTSKFLPEVWHQVKGFFPILVVLVVVLGITMFAIFGGGADTFVEFGAKSREQAIDEMR